MSEVENKDKQLTQTLGAVSGDVGDKDLFGLFLAGKYLNITT
jgi:hypothetical protein